MSGRATHQLHQQLPSQGVAMDAHQSQHQQYQYYAPPMGMGRNVNAYAMSQQQGVMNDPRMMMHTGVIGSNSNSTIPTTQRFSQQTHQHGHGVMFHPVQMVHHTPSPANVTPSSFGSATSTPTTPGTVTGTGTGRSPRYVGRNPSVNKKIRRQFSRQSTNNSDELGLPALDRIPSINVNVAQSRPTQPRPDVVRSPTSTLHPDVFLQSSDGVTHTHVSAVHVALARRALDSGTWTRVPPAMTHVMTAAKPMLLCKILSFVSCRDKCRVCLLVSKTWKLCVHNPLSYSVVKLDFNNAYDAHICLKLSYVMFRLKLLVITDAAQASPTVLLELLRHVQSVRAIWLKCSPNSANDVLDETFTISLLHVVGRSCEIIRLDYNFSVSIGYALSESCSNLRQLILSNWTNHSSLLGEVTTLGFRCKQQMMNGLTSAAVGVENGTALHPLLLLLSEIGNGNEYLERLTIQFGMEIDRFAKGMRVASGRAGEDDYDAWEVFERVLIERLHHIANRFAHRGGADQASQSDWGKKAKKLKVTISFRENCVNILAFAHRVRSSIPDRIINVRIQKTTRK